MKDSSPSCRGNAVGQALLAARAAIRLGLPALLGVGLPLAVSARIAVAGSQGLLPEPAASATDPAKLSESIRLYERLVKEHPESAERWSNLGVVRAMAGDCTEALPALQRAVSMNAELSNAWFFSGYCYSALHQSQRANDNLQRAVRLRPQDPNVWLLRAQVSADLGRLEDSLEAVVRAQSLGLTRPEAYYLVGKDALELAAGFYDQVAGAADLYSLILDGQRNAALGVWEPAMEEYQRALKIAPHRPDLQFAIGTAYLEKAQFGDADAAFRRCLELSPDSSWTQLRLALALVQQSKESEALALWRGVRLADLRSPDEYQDYLACAYLLKRADAAQAALSLAEKKFGRDGGWTAWRTRLAAPLRRDSENAIAPLKLEALTGIGLSLRFYLTTKQARGNVFESLFPSPAAYHAFQSDFLLGRWKEAAVRIVPVTKVARQTGSTERAFALGQILQSLSYGFYRQLGAEFPDSPPAMTLAAENLASMGQPDKALEIYQGMLQRDGPSPDVLREMAGIYWADHQWDKALEVLEPLARMDPNDSTVLVNLGRIYFSQQKFENASETFRHALRVEPGMPEAHIGLGQALRSEGDLPGALRELKEASQIDPSNPKPHYELSQIYAKLGDRKHAAEEMANFEHLGATASSAAKRRKGLLGPLD